MYTWWELGGAPGGYSGGYPGLAGVASPAGSVFVYEPLCDRKNASTVEPCRVMVGVAPGMGREKADEHRRRKSRNVSKRKILMPRSSNMLPASS